MGFFGSKPKVSKREFSEACSGLYSKGFTSSQVNKVKSIFAGDLYESVESQKGIDSGEIATRMKWMRKNKSVHGFSSKQMDVIEKQLRSRL